MLSATVADSPNVYTQRNLTNNSGNTDSTNNFTIYHENVRSIMKKRTEILLSTKDIDYDCISINETWLHPSHNDNEFMNERYIVYRKDRKFSNINASKGGGVFIGYYWLLTKSTTALLSHTLKLNH